MSAYPLYDVPWLVRDPDEFYMSPQRHAIELRNQAVVDDYFITRDQGLTAHEARKATAKKHQMSTRRVQVILVWFCKEAKKRGKIDFLEKFSLLVTNKS
ncbi:MAG: hypothetical protein IKU05_05920 [Bacteroidales bacterium]|nr:hypothetical protein [Bacteroidales bacterium]